MPVNQQDLSYDARVRADVSAIFEDGFFDVDASRIAYVCSLSVFGGSSTSPVSLLAFRDAFREFLLENEELAGELLRIAECLLGIDRLYRNTNRRGREAAAGDIEWEGKTQAPSSVRRRGTGRRDKVLDKIAIAITLAEGARTREGRPGSLITTNEPRADTSPNSADSLPSIESIRSRRRWPFAVVALACVIGLGAYLASIPTGSPNHAKSARIGGYTPARRAVFHCIRRPECPGPNYPVFDSYTNAPNYGDERDFINIRRLHSQTWDNDLAVTSGEEVVLRIYYDNDGDPRTEPRPGASTARSTRVTVLLPHARNREMNVDANITASNAHPRTIGDAVTLHSAKPFDLIYMPHTAYLWNRAHPRGLALPNDLLDSGALIGYEKMNGSVTGCFCQSGLITLSLLIE